MKTDITVAAEPRASRGKNEARGTDAKGSLTIGAIVPPVVPGKQDDEQGTAELHPIDDRDADRLSFDHPGRYQRGAAFRGGCGH